MIKRASKAKRFSVNLPVWEMGWKPSYLRDYQYQGLDGHRIRAVSTTKGLPRCSRFSDKASSNAKSLLWLAPSRRKCLQWTLDTMDHLSTKVKPFPDSAERLKIKWMADNHFSSRFQGFRLSKSRACSLTFREHWETSLREFHLVNLDLLIWETIFTLS